MLVFLFLFFFQTCVGTIVQKPLCNIMQLLWLVLVLLAAHCAYFFIFLTITMIVHWCTTLLMTVIEKMNPQGREMTRWAQTDQHIDVSNRLGYMKSLVQ